MSNNLLQPNHRYFFDGSRDLSWISVAGLLLLTVSAVWIVLYHLSGSSLWLDEAYTWWFVRQNWTEMFIAIRLDGVHPPLYYMLQKLLVGFIGRTESDLRLFSVLVYLVGLAFSALLGQRVGGGAGALAAAWFWAYHPAAVLYAREARPYAFLAMVSTASLYFFLSAQNNSRKRESLLGGLALASGLLIHYFFLLPFGITLLAALADLHRKRVFFRRWAVISLVAALPFFAWLLWFNRLENPSFGIGWIQKPSLVDLPLTLWNLLSGYGGANSLPVLLFGMTAAGMLLLGLFARHTRSFSFRWVISGLLLPLVGVWLISHQRPVYIDRYFLVLLPVVSMLVSAGASSAWDWICNTFVVSKRAGILIFCMLVFGILGIYSGWQVHRDPKYRNEDWRGLIAYLDRYQAGLPQVWFPDPAISIPFAYYNQANYQVIQSEGFPFCQTPCWWPLRQPYTVTHAFTQSITDPLRPWKPEIPPDCLLLDSWESDTHLALWQVQCK